MSRKSFISIVASLLCLLPALTYAQSLTRYEYWFDDDFAGRVLGNLSGASDAVSLSIGTDQLENGIHKFSFRARQSDGKYSAITSSLFLKLSGGKASQLEYWVDGDYEHARTISGELASDGKDYKFITDLDLGNLSPGHHRLYCRPVSNSRLTVGAVTSMPIIVKSRYANINPSSVAVTHYSIGIDNEEPTIVSLPNPDADYTLKDGYDARRLSAGTHQLKLKFYNSAGAAVSEESSFTVQPYQPPTIQLTAQEANGLVDLQYNSVPYDLGYRVFRVDAQGARSILFPDKSNMYPIALHHTDNPPAAGNYTYHVEAFYRGVDGSKTPVSSNEVTVTVPGTTTDYGFVEGAVYFDNYRKSGVEASVQFSDGVVVPLSADGVFRRDKIPAGSELTVSLAYNEEYVSNTVPVTVYKGKNKVIRIDAIKRFDFSVVETPQFGTLDFGNYFEYVEGDCFKFDVIARKPWEGKIRVKAIAKKDDKKREPLDIHVDPANTQVLAGSVSSLPSFRTTTYQIFETENTIYLDGRQSQRVTVPIDKLTNNEEQQLFNFYFYSVDTDGTLHLIYPNRDQSTSNVNPIAYEIAGGQKDDESKIAFLVDLIVYYCSTVKDLDDRLGKMSKAFDEIKGITGASLNYPTFEALSTKIESAYTIYDLYDDDGLRQLTRIINQESSRFSDLTKSFRKKLDPVVREAKSFLDLTKGIRKALKTIKEIRTDGAKTDCERVFDFTEKFLNLTDDALGGYGFSTLLKSYLDITRAAINAIHNLAIAQSEGWIELPGDFHNNNLVIKIKILKKNGKEFNFWRYGTSIIKEVLVKGWNVSPNSIATAWFGDVSTEYFPVIVKSKAVFNETRNDSNDPQTSGIVTNLMNENFHELWAEIYWENGRVSFVPLKELDGAVTFERLSIGTSIFTICFQSETDEDDYTHIPDLIHLNY